MKKRMIKIGIIIIFSIFLLATIVHATAPEMEEYDEEYIKENYDKVREKIIQDVLGNEDTMGTDPIETPQQGISRLSESTKVAIYKNIKKMQSINPEDDSTLRVIAEQIAEVIEVPSETSGTGESFKFPSIGDLFKKANAFITTGSGGNTIGDDDLAPAVQIGQLLMTIAIIVLLIVTIIMAIKYMIASPEEQGKLKQQLIGLVVSAAVIFGAYIIWQMAVNLMTSVTK